MSTPPTTSSTQRVIVMASLIFAGEAIFGLPFHVSRFFRPTMLKVFDLTNTELGTIFSFYGILAMIAYLPGGAIADRFSTRKLLTASMMCTAIGGLYLATIPDYLGMSALFAFWGVTTILMFWAALIRATREWGGSDDQGKAFGILDSGRGLLAAGLASAAALLFGVFFPDDPTTATDAQRLDALRNIIHVYTATTLAGGVFVWFFVPERSLDARSRPVRGETWARLKKVVAMPAIWLQALIVVCAYCAYKGGDYYSLFAVEAYGMDEVEGARLSAFSAWVRPLAALGAGLLADRITPTRVSGLCFALLVVGYTCFAVVEPDPNLVWVLFVNVMFACVAVFGLRGVYFAIMEETCVPAHVTGTAVGLISLVGYTPDIFVAPLAGVLLDRSPGATGHQHFFMFLLGMSALGSAAVLVLRRLQPAEGSVTTRGST